MHAFEPLALVSGTMVLLIVGGAFLALLFVLMPIVLFVVAMLEPYRVRPLTAIANADAPATGAKVIEEAQADGFVLIGRFKVDDSGWTKSSATLLLSPDARSVLWVQHSRAGARHRLMTQLADDRWIVTSTIIGVRDSTGLIDEEMLPDTALDVLLYYHNQRLTTDAARSAVTLQAQEVVDDLFRLERNRADRLAELRLAHFTNSDRTDFRLNFRGATRIIGGYISGLLAMNRRSELSKQKALEVQAMKQYSQQMGKPATPSVHG